jgi:hypothetical protein
MGDDAGLFPAALADDKQGRFICTSARFRLTFRAMGETLRPKLA